MPAEDLSTLEIKVLYDSVGGAERRLDALEKQGRQTEKSMKGMSASVGGSLKSLLGFASAGAAVTATMAGLRAVVSKTRDYQVLRAALEQTTGSAAAMEAKWKDLVKFASDTPFSLEQAVGGFNKLVNLGLEPSERAMKSYGETASAMGKDLSQMIEAVADASTGEFERLKEFGIKTKTEGDKVTFTFRDVKTTVAKESADIEEYLIKLGENNFAGSMQKRMETLDGAISNLGDTWDQLLFSIGQSGIGDAAEEGIRDITKALQDLKDWIDSGAMQESLDAWTSAWDVWGDENKTTIDQVGEGWAALVKLGSDLLDEHADDVHEDGERPWLGVKTTIQSIPAAIHAFTKIAAAELRRFAIEAQGIIGAIGLEIEGLGARMTAEAAANNPDSNFQLGLPHAKSSLWDVQDGTQGQGGNRPQLPGQATQGAVFDGGAFGVLPALEADTEARKASFASETAAAMKEAEEYANQVWNEAADEYQGKVDEIIEHNNQADTALDRFRKRNGNGNGDKPKPKPKKDGSGSSGGSGGGKGGGSDSEFQSLVDSLKKEEDAINESYIKRLAIIEAHTAEGSRIRMDLELALTDELEKEQLARNEQLKKEPETYREAMAAELEIIKTAYEQRRAIILESTQLTEDQKLKLLADAQDKYRKAQAKHWSEDIKGQLSAASSLFENLQTLGNAFGKKGFEIAKAAALANAAIKGPEAVMNAYNEGLKISAYAAPVFAAVAAATVGAQIGQIAASEYKGAYATGGLIPAGGFGLVGEAGPELVRGPAVVSSAQNSADRWARGSGEGNQLKVVVENYGGEAVRVVQIDDAQVKVIVGEAVQQSREAVAKDIDTGGTKIDRSIREAYRTKRG